MTEVQTTERFRYELRLGDPPDDPASTGALRGRRGDAMSNPILVSNVIWLCRMRWAVVGVLAGFGALAEADGLMRRLGLNDPGLWPWAAAGILAVANAGFMVAARGLRNSSDSGRTIALLWAQVVLDLLVLTAAVHFTGSMSTFVAFTYLFHIVLTCMFFRRIQSLLVTFLAILLFSTCLLAEQTGLLTAQTIIAGPPGLAQGAADATSLRWHVLSAVAIWLIVWYLASHLAELVRRRDVALDVTNHRLMAAVAERSRHMLRTTHQLKAPLAAVESNTQLLLKGYCGPISKEAEEVCTRMSTRCAALREEIQEMLQLANLRSASQCPPDRELVDLADLLRWAIEQVRQKATERDVTVETDLESARTMVARDHLRMMATILLTNAVIYSYVGGRVCVTCRQNERDEAIVTIADEGIGITAEKMPRIFDEHYRTTTAVRHISCSSGLGLTIVRDVAELYGIHLAVTSAPGRGTTFELRFAPPDKVYGV